MNNCYLGDGTVHLGEHLLFIHELCELFKCAGISTSQVKRKLFSLSLKGRAVEWYKTLKDGRSIGWEEIVPLFYSKFYPSSEIHLYQYKKTQRGPDPTNLNHLTIMQRSILTPC
jgi:hypothetical protein